MGDRSRVRIFSAGTGETRLEEVADLANPEARANDDELASYAAGEGRPGARTATQQDSASEHATDLFSKNVARYLDKARNDNRYDSLYLVAAPEFLGHLREDLSREVRKLVADQLDKDVSWFNARDLERYLDKAL